MLLALGGSARGARAAGGSAFDLTVTARPVSSPLPPGFLGLALEDGTIPEWVSQDGHPDPLLPILLRNLAPTGAPSIRIGGQSGDRSWWPIPGERRPVGVTQSLGAAWISSARQLVRETGAQLLLGLNLEAGSARIAQVEAAHLVRGIGAAHIRALELGNEPNLYRAIPWFRVQGHHILPWYAKTGAPAYSRPSGWGPAAYAAQLTSFTPRLPRVPLAGPDTTPGPWARAFAGLRGTRGGVLTSHAYGLNQCVTNPALPGYPSIAHLLSLQASRGMYAGVPHDLALARQHGMRYRIDEMGSVTCNGRPGVSNTFASALWGMDALFDAARIGVGGVNLHSYPHSANGLFDLTYDPSTHRWRAIIHPLYDGVLMFAQAAPAGARLLHIVSPHQTTMRAWATRGAGGRVRVLLVNDGPAASVRVRVPAAERSRAAVVERLHAPGPAATRGITIGGRTFSATSSGIPPAPVLQSLTPRAGTFALRLPAASAALLTFPAL
jgi:hypothetical protein